jgi:two-component system response regulator YesN
MKRELSEQPQRDPEKVVSLSEKRKKRISMEVKTYIDSNYKSDINLGGLADNLGVSQSYLSGIFKEKENVSPVEYINTVKLNKAKELMKTSELNFTQIAEKVGYQNVYYFSRIFKKKNKVTPSKYRELINEERDNISDKQSIDIEP